ncbi:4'-phosphopantetheinyl transferase family protein [Aquicella siphonis]|nr:4'-phosphopantetheinyl transferase superfamily protein [Aquicella siphonis]
MLIDTHEVQIWFTDLTLTREQENERFDLLSIEERERALRFHFPIHKQRFIAARSMLRSLLGLYLACAPQDIAFAYDENEKPRLQTSGQMGLQFNLSHSDHMAVYAFTLHHAVGVDIEKIRDTYNPDVAERYFSRRENQDLLSLPHNERTAGFYRIWARKEAIVKAVGKGLTMPLSRFSVSARDICEDIQLDHDGSWKLMPLAIHPAFQSAVAASPMIHTLSYWSLFEQHQKLDKVYNL